jgi:Protein of unknown function (DUF2975)
MPSTRELSASVNHLQRIRRISRAMVFVCMGLIVVLPVALAWCWATLDASELARQSNLPGTAVQLPLLAWQRWVSGGVTGVPLVMLLVGVWHAKRCFEQFAKGHIFTAQATLCLRRFAGWVAAAALAAIVAGTLTSVLLTLQNPPGMRWLAVGFSSNHLLTLFFATLVWLMAHVIGQGQLLADENQSFV